jgi:hypothetical protein
MGAASELYLLDHDVMVDCIAPAIFRLLETGRPGPWLQAFGNLFKQPFPFSVLPVRRPESVITYLDADLSEMPGAGPEDGFPGWPRNEMGAYDFMVFVQDLLARYCFRDFWSFGNAKDVCLKWQCYEEFVAPNHPQTDRLDVLINLLGGRGRHWCHGGGGFCEGIHGWLRPDETAELATLMASLPLPTCERTWNGLREWDRLHGDSDEINQYEGAYYAKYILYLSVSAAVAARSQLGLLYGNDIYSLLPKRRTDTGWLTWRANLLARAARAIRESREFADLPILGDMLEEAGCDQADMIAHCREGSPHKKTCWVVNMLADGAPLCRDIFGLIEAPID